MKKKVSANRKARRERELSIEEVSAGILTGGVGDVKAFSIEEELFAGVGGEFSICDLGFSIGMGDGGFVSSELLGVEGVWVGVCCVSYVVCSGFLVGEDGLGRGWLLDLASRSSSICWRRAVFRRSCL